jgi:hypothetical protein
VQTNVGVLGQSRATLAEVGFGAQAQPYRALENEMQAPQLHGFAMLACERRVRRNALHRR